MAAARLVRQPHPVLAPVRVRHPQPSGKCLEVAHLLVLKTVRRRESKKRKEKKYRNRETEKKICYNQLLGGDQLHPMAKDVIALSSYSWSHSVLRFSGSTAF